LVKFFKLNKLKRYFPHLQSVKEFITSVDYLGEVVVEVSGLKEIVHNITPQLKLDIALMVSKSISIKAKMNTSDFKGTKIFEAKMIKDVFRDKTIKIDIDEVTNKRMQEIELADKEWYGQNDFYGTDEERSFIKFLDSFIEQLKQEYTDIVLLRNEKFFQIYEFNEGRPFEPDFLLLLAKEGKVANIYQIFIEPKGNQFKDKAGGFKDSKEGWKEKFLLEIEEKADTNLKHKNKHYNLIGLPFYNEKLKKDFEEAFKAKILT